ncbi:hypothetical protein F8388_002920 [Cannabis sativa]|uniref:3-hydroxyacyl-CoA dehydrogenase NAD binding domain-containing protein n=1 Tax=Cannabis sativa TaxID=3483 RepID=A0A7J6H5J1_CANSA|nr:hypothetical protein F8388_002920 [Cannabis sativa]
MPFLEIVRTEKTSPQVIVDLLSVAKTINKVAVVVRNCPGFAVNRTFFPYTTAQGSHLLVHLVRLQDLIGYKVSIASGNELPKAYPDRTFVSPLVELLIKSGRNGKKNGRRVVFFALDQGIVIRPSDLDVASVLRISFPSHL